MNGLVSCYACSLIALRLFLADRAARSACIQYTQQQGLCFCTAAAVGISSLHATPA